MNGAAAITGIGVVSSLGVGREAFLRGLQQGRSGLREITLFTPQGRCRIGGEIDDVDPTARVSPKQHRRMDRGTRLAAVAALEALADAGLDADDLRQLRVGIALGTCAGGMAQAIELWEGWRQDRLRPGLLMQSTPHAGATWLGRLLECRGPSATFSTACSASATALGFALDVLRADLADVVVAGGYEPFCELSFAGFECMRAFAADTVRPFDAKRSGLLLGEGAAIFVLERPEIARSRSVEVAGRLLGYGASCDAFHTTMPDPKALGATNAIVGALRDSGLRPHDIDHVNAHGTATRLNDPAETRAIHAALGDRAATTPVTSVKSALGHTLGAAGALEVAASLLAANAGFIPPTLNYETPDSECALDVVANAARPAHVRRFLSNSFGFGGSNISLAVETAHELPACC
jgi:3-oxoacyl-[acyl-carrier-protein] synthase II